MRSRGSFMFGLGAGARKSLVLLWTAVFLCSLFLQYVVLAAPAPALAINPNVFELDGNVENGAAPGDDWNAVYNGSDSAFETLFVTDPINGNGDKYFDGGQTKDVTNIPSWLWTTTSQPQDKNDISHAYAAAYRDAGHLLVYVGLDRYASNGAGQVGFWFLQGDFGLTGGPAAGAFTGSHQNGDVLVQIDFENGGASPVARVYKWNNGGLVLVEASGSCAVSIAEDQCAIASTGTTDPVWLFDDKFAGGTNNLIPAGGMVEAGVDLTALGLDGGCFASFIAETRSSPSEDSTLSDFAFGNFALCSKPDITTHVRQGGDNISVINKGESVYDHASLAGDSGTVTGSVKFFVCRDADTNPDCSTGGDQVGGSVDLVDGAANSAQFTPTQLGYYCFRVDYTPAQGSKYLASSHTNRTTECFQVIPAEIKLTKTADDASVSAGEPIGFTLTILSKGPGSAYGVKVSDTLPTNGGLAWTIDSANTTGTWVIDAGVLRFGGPDGITMPKDASYSVHVVSPTTKATCGVVNNTGDATTTNDGTSSDSASVTVLCPDIKVTKLPDDGVINAGDTATFSIKVENLGPGNATGVVVSDALPAGLTWTEDEADCSIAAGVLTCNVGDLAVGASKTYTVSAVTSKANCGDIDNTATATATNERAADEGNNSDDGTITVKCAAIEVVKDADDAQVNAGDDIGFTITVSNTGDGTAYDVTASDTLNGDFTWTLDPSAGWSLIGNQLSYSAAQLLPGASSSVHVSAPTTADNCGVVPNTATASAANDGSDSDDAQTEILCPDVTVTKTAVTGTVSAGDPIAFDITVTNLGPGVAYDVTLTDPLPAGITWTDDSDACSITDGVLSCDFGDLAVDGSATVRISGTTSNAVCGVVSNTATVAAGNEAETDTGNNTDSDSVTVNCPDIKVVKSADVTPISAGDLASFTITVTNLGPGTATGVTLSDTLPAGIDWSENSAACSIAAGILSCDFGSLAAGTSRAVTVSGTTSAADCGDVPNTAVVAATNEIPGATANNTDSATIEVLCPDIKVTKTADNSPISAGDEASFTILVENIGQGAAYDVTLSDELPGAGITWTEDSDACSISDSVLTCDFGTILSGASRTVHVSGETTAADCGQLPNLASALATNEPGDVLGNNSDDASITVDCPQIVITKSTVTPVVSATDDISFDIVVTNTGAGNAYGVTVNDPLPVVPGVSFTIDGSLSDAGWSITDGTLAFGPATLASGESVSVRIVSGTTADSCGPVTNVASLTYEGGSGSDDSSLVVECPDVTISKTADNSPILAGEDASFTISVWNQGPGTAYDVVISDELPAGVDWTEDSEACEIVDGTLTCEVGTLADNDDPFTVVVSGPTTVESCGDLDNLAAVSASNEPEDNLGNNEDDATVEVQCASISLVKTAGNAADGTELLVATPGNVTFTYVVTNTGTADLVNLVLVDDNATPDDTSDDIDVCFSTSLAAGASMTCTVTLPVTYGLRTNIAVVTANPEIAPDEEVSATDDAVVRVPEPVVTPTPRPTPKITPPPTSTLDSNGTPNGAGTGLLLVLLSLAGTMLALGYLIPSPAHARRRNRRG